MLRLYIVLATWLVCAVCSAADDCNAQAPSRLLQAQPGPAAAAVYWAAPRLLYWPALQATPGARWWLQAGNRRWPLRPTTSTLPPLLAWLPPGQALALPAAARPHRLLRQALVVVMADAQGRELQRSGVQTAAALDALYADAAAAQPLGVQASARHTRFALWAPTAQAVALCLYPDGEAEAEQVLPLRRNAAGTWQRQLASDLSGKSYTYLVDVHVRGLGLVRNRVTDPYSISLSTDSRRSWIGSLANPALAPAGWADDRAPATVQAPTDAVIYELHLRDFSASDPTVPEPQRGKYLAFTQADSLGMRHLRALAAAGVTDVHLLPVFDFSSVPERGCSTPAPQGAPDSAAQQATVMAGAAGDCFNWGYDPWHYAAPEGSYASDAADGAVRIVEFRRMVTALHRAGLRVGMDMVFNHTAAAGQDARSVLDRIVPGYYQRLDLQGRLETSTCCANTATEHRMMARLMIDAAVVWARDHHVDSMRFDLMGHQPRSTMQALRRAVNAATGRAVLLIGEGWDFGEVAGNRRFVQAAQGRLDGTGIATFSDRARDAIRGGGCCDDAAATLARKGWITGGADDAHGADLVRAGLAGTLRGYRMTLADGSVKTLAELPYAGTQFAGYASQPGEVVNYVENHDNPTLFDIAMLKLPPHTPPEERARVQLLGLALTALSQGVAYFHAGSELMRSKSGDRNSFDSGDWFNVLDLGAGDNGFGRGLPPRADNGALWPALAPLLADPALKPGPQHIRFVRDAFLDLLRIRAATPLLRLRSADDVQRRLTFFNTGPQQVPGVIVGHLDGAGLPQADVTELLYAVNAGTGAQTLALPALRGRPFVLHRQQRADARVHQARWEAAAAMLTVPARTAVVFGIIADPNPKPP